MGVLFDVHTIIYCTPANNGRGLSKLREFLNTFNLALKTYNCCNNCCKELPLPWNSSELFEADNTDLSTGYPGTPGYNQQPNTPGYPNPSPANKHQPSPQNPSPFVQPQPSPMGKYLTVMLNRSAGLRSEILLVILYNFMLLSKYQFYFFYT